MTIGPMTFYCGKCGARPGQKCFSKGGKVHLKYHNDRKNKAAEYKRIHAKPTEGVGDKK